MNDAALRFLVNLQPKQPGTHELPNQKHRFGDTEFQVEWLFSDEPNAKRPGLEWYSFSSRDWDLMLSHWDKCHKLHHDLLGKGYRGVFVEPDSPVWYLYRDFSPIMLDPCTFRDSINRWQAKPEWIDQHLDLTELRQARKFVADNTKGSIRIGHIDTGYDPKHKVRPANLNYELQRNFVAGEAEDCAADNPAYSHFGFPFQYGHGTGTISILAGNKLEGVNPAGANTRDYLGGAPYADVVPIRISETVIQLIPRLMAQGIHYATQPRVPSKRCDVISISMGGPVSECWTRRVNEAYKAGVCIVAAAGNNYDGVFSTDTVWPARYNRVIGVTGVMTNGSPYAKLPLFVMSGNYGPPTKLCSSIAAYTPNIPWPAFHCDNLVHLDGAGTSAATPQIAAAAALYLQFWGEKGAFLDKPLWYRVEAARQALFTTAAAPAVPSDSQYLGRGILSAMCALKCKPPKKLEMTPPDTTAPPFVIEETKKVEVRHRELRLMYQVEIAQLLHQCRALRAILPDPYVDAGKVSPTQRKAVFQAIVSDRMTSTALSSFLKQRALKKRTL